MELVSDPEYHQNWAVESITLAVLGASVTNLIVTLAPRTARVIDSTAQFW